MTKFQIEAGEIRRAIALVSGVKPRKATRSIPVLGTVRLTYDGTTGTITSNNLDIQIRADVEIQGDPVDITLDRGVFRRLACATGPVSCELDADILTAVVNGFSLRLRMVTCAADFPVMNWSIPPSTGGWTLSASALHRLVVLARDCISAEETRYYLNGLFLTTNKKTGAMRGVSTDGHRMAVIDVPDAKSGTGKAGAPRAGIMPTEAAVALLSAFPKGLNHPVDLVLDGPKFQASAPGVEVKGKLIDGTYPDYTRVVPKEGGNLAAVISRTQIETANRLLPTSPRGRPIRIDSSAGLATIRAPEYDGASLSFPIQESAAHGGEIGLKFEYLLSAVRTSGDVRLEWESAMAPVRVTNSDPDAFWVIMPMKL